MNKKLGNVIREIRKKQGVSLRKLAESVGVSFVNISYIENGRIETSKNVLKKISEALDYDFDKLLALAKKVDDDVTAIINKRPNAVPNFLRSAKNLNNNDWEELKKHVQKINKRKENK